MQKFKFFTLAILAMLSVNFVWGADVTYSFSAQGKANQEIWYGDDIDSYTSWSATKGTNDPAYYNIGTGLRIYKDGGTFNISSSKKIASITLTFSGTGYTFSEDNTTNPQTVNPNATSYTWTVSRTCRLQKVEITYAAAATATITKTANLTNFTYEVGSGPSAAQSFTVGGTNLTANITVTAPTNFEVSKSSGSGYASSVTLTQSSGTVSNTTIYVRMKSGLSQGTGKGGNISLTSTGATTQTIAVVGTVTAPSYTITAQSNNTELGTVSGTTTITASPKTCVGYANPAYTVTPAGKATVAQSGNIFTVSNVTDNVTVTINFAELPKDTYEDHLHGNDPIEKCGSYEAPSLPDAAKATEGNCDVVHYHFAGWVTDPISTGTPGAPSGMITAGTAMNANGTTYIAVWAKEE